ncbi:hypothetical protein C2E20_5334 [Micractinium conductrix]|uniref:Uncharacterized protein n=1 Tax=Micractinium conductrix TaxID=554055 RepID=A0A2P6VBC1_9CHLO|nr:hypothetical protein C2E20_5334 [Micractinium conductrix]|eukprot:PSC71383.1 hypothetical protein C2E20_5334 [Micractinium conductrix]
MQALRQAATSRLAAAAACSSCQPVASSWIAAAQQLQQAAGYAKKSGGESMDNRLKSVLSMLEPRDVDEVELSPEDHADATRRAKEYSRLKMAAHRAWQADLSTKLNLKRAAIAALPEHLRAAAEKPDYEPFPLTRQMWNETPPIEGFGEGAASTQAAGARRLGTKHRK